MNDVLKRAGLFFIIACGAIAPAAIASQTGKGQVSQFPSDQPFAEYFTVEEFLDWSPQESEDAVFNVSRVPLARRFPHSEYKVNNHARAGEGRVSPIAMFRGDKCPAQGSLGAHDIYAFNYWQYTDVMVYWGGCPGVAGLAIRMPMAGVVDAAHQNGVPVVSNIFFPPAEYGGQLKWVDAFLQKEGDRFPVADKLIEARDYFGFDGWFINQETPGGDRELAGRMMEFLQYIRSKSDMLLYWYDAMTEQGDVAWQETLNEKNDGFFQGKDGLISHFLFLDFGWHGVQLRQARDHARMLERSEYSLFAGIDVQARGVFTPARWSEIFPQGKPHVTSVGFYMPAEQNFRAADDVDDFYQRANRFWVGNNRNPACTDTRQAWKGLAHYVPANSPVTCLPFVTHFCTGHGNDFYLKGVRVSPDAWHTSGWNNLSLQDVLPTWRWIVESDEQPLYPEMDWSDAYYGGNCLKMSGHLKAENRMRLYSTRLDLTDKSQMDVIFKTGQMGPSRMAVALTFLDDPAQRMLFNAGESVTEGWQKITLDLSGHQGRTVTEIGLVFFGGGSGKYTMKLGGLRIYNRPAPSPQPVRNLRVLRMVEESPVEASVRLMWEPASAQVHRYHIYQVNGDSTRTFLGGTPNNAWFIPSVMRKGEEREIVLAVRAVSWAYAESPETVTRVSFSRLRPPDDAQLIFPADGSRGLSRNLSLAWRVDETASDQEICWGTDNPPGACFSGFTEHYSCHGLDSNTTYYWQIQSRNAAGVTRGPVWSFTTGAGTHLPVDCAELGDVEITVHGENAPYGETRDKAFDNDPATKWLDFANPTWIEVTFKNERPVTAYSLTSANDVAERDPESWVLKGSRDGVTWTLLDQRGGETFPQRFQKRLFSFFNDTPYAFYRFEFQAARGGLFQISEIELIDASGY